MPFIVPTKYHQKCKSNHFHVILDEQIKYSAFLFNDTTPQFPWA